MNKKYIFSFFLGFASMCMAPKSQLIASSEATDLPTSEEKDVETEAIPKEEEAIVMPSFGQDIIDYTGFFILSPSFSAFGYLSTYFFGDYLKVFFKNDSNINSKILFLGGTLISLVLSVVAIIGLASWPGLWEIKGGKQKRSQTLSFPNRLWRVARLIMSTFLFPIISFVICTANDFVNGDFSILFVFLILPYLSAWMISWIYRLLSEGEKVNLKHDGLDPILDQK